MRIVTLDDGRTTAISENEIERLALEDLGKHRPFFAVAEQAMVAAFQRGYKEGMERGLAHAKDVAEKASV